MIGYSDIHRLQNRVYMRDLWPGTSLVSTRSLALLEFPTMHVPNEQSLLSVDK